MSIDLYGDNTLSFAEFYVDSEIKRYNLRYRDIFNIIDQYLITFDTVCENDCDSGFSFFSINFCKICDSNLCNDCNGEEIRLNDWIILKDNDIFCSNCKQKGCINCLNVCYNCFNNDRYTKTYCKYCTIYKKSECLDHNEYQCNDCYNKLEWCGEEFNENCVTCLDMTLNGGRNVFGY